MRISDWSSDVCSSDRLAHDLLVKSVTGECAGACQHRIIGLAGRHRARRERTQRLVHHRDGRGVGRHAEYAVKMITRMIESGDLKSGVLGMSVCVVVDRWVTRHI